MALRIELEVLDLPRGLKAERHREEGRHIHGPIFPEIWPLGHRPKAALLSRKPFRQSRRLHGPTTLPAPPWGYPSTRGGHPFKTAMGLKTRFARKPSRFLDSLARQPAGHHETASGAQFKTGRAEAMLRESLMATSIPLDEDPGGRPTKIPAGSSGGSVLASRRWVGHIW
jgi:hypothetical protein